MKLLLLGLMIAVSMPAQSRAIEHTEIFHIKQYFLYSYSGPYNLEALKVRAENRLQLKGAKLCSPLLARQYGDLKIISFDENFGGLAEMGFYCSEL